MSMDKLQIGAGTELAILGEHSAVAVDGKGAKCQRCGRVLKHGFVLDGFIYGPVCVRKMGGVVVAVTRTAPKKVAVDIETTADRDQLNCFEQQTTEETDASFGKPNEQV